MLFGGISRQMLGFTGQMAEAIKQGRLGARDYLDPYARTFRQRGRWLQDDRPIFNSAFKGHEFTFIQ
jgi:hypothetical protein